MPFFSCRAPLLDLDGVLVDSTDVIRRNWTRWAARHALDAEAVIRGAQGRRTPETVRLVAPHLNAEAELAVLADAAIWPPLPGRACPQPPAWS